MNSVGAKPPKTCLVIGNSNVARHVEASLVSMGFVVRVLLTPDDSALDQAFRVQYDRIAVVTHDDVLALRYALSAAHVSPSTPMIVTVFDRTIATRLRQILPHSLVTSPADLAAPILAGACIAADLLAVGHNYDGRSFGVRDAHRGPEVGPVADLRRPLWRSIAVRSSGLFRTPDTGTRMLVWGLLGVVGIIVADFLWLVLGKRYATDTAVLDAVKVVTTVGPAPEAHGGYAIVSALAMLVTVLLTAMVTGGVVDRILGPRLVGLVGSRVLPRSGHVIVVGLGQVGLRLCRELTAFGVDVVGVERNPSAAGLRLTRALSIPAVVIGRGDDRRLLERVGIRRALAVAVVGSEDSDNIATAVVAQAVAPDVRVVLRAGEYSALSDTGSLLPLGVVRDVSVLSAAYVVAWIAGENPRSVVSDGHTLWIQVACETFVPFSLMVEKHCTRSASGDHPLVGVALDET